MEGYNNWKLPFAKTVSVKGNGAYELFPDNFYTVILDPCAYFTVLFVSSKLTSTTLTLTTIDFNYYGEYGIPMSGFWMNVKFLMRDQRDWEATDYESYTWTQWCFVA